MQEIQDFLNSPKVTSLSKASQDKYKFALQHFEKFLSGLQGHDNLCSSSCSEETLSSFCKQLKDAKKSANTIQQYVTVIKLLCRFHNINFQFTYRTTSFDKKKQKLKMINRWFDESDIEKCLGYGFDSITDKQIRMRNILLVRIAIETGARIREIANINGKDFDLSNHTVFLNESKTEPRPAFYSPKTAEIVSFLYDSTVTFFKSDWNVSIFPSVDQCKKIITGMLDDLGLKRPGDGRGPHTFRHYVATHLYYNGDMELNDLAIVLGDKPDTIRDNYLHPTPAMLRRRVEKAWGWNNNFDAIIKSYTS